MKKNLLALAMMATLFSFTAFAGDMPDPGYTSCPPPETICFDGDMPDPGYACPELPPNCLNSTNSPDAGESSNDSGESDSVYEQLKSFLGF